MLLKLGKNITQPRMEKKTHVFASEHRRLVPSISHFLVQRKWFVSFPYPDSGTITLILYAVFYMSESLILFFRHEKCHFQRKPFVCILTLLYLRFCLLILRQACRIFTFLFFETGSWDFLNWVDERKAINI